LQKQCRQDRKLADLEEHYFTMALKEITMRAIREEKPLELYL